MKKWLCGAMVFVFLVLIPDVVYTEDTQTIALAQTLYALARNEPDCVLYALGSVVMNRVNSVWYPDTTLEVLDEQHQFARGMRYDMRCLRIARDILSGARTLNAYFTEYGLASVAPERAMLVGNYYFTYRTEGR